MSVSPEMGYTQILLIKLPGPLPTPLYPHTHTQLPKGLMMNNNQCCSLYISPFTHTYCSQTGKTLLLWIRVSYLVSVLSLIRIAFQQVSLLNQQ